LEAQEEMRIIWDAFFDGSSEVTQQNLAKFKLSSQFQSFLKDFSLDEKDVGEYLRKRKDRKNQQLRNKLGASTNVGERAGNFPPFFSSLY